MTKKFSYILVGIAVTVILGLVWALVAIASTSNNQASGGKNSSPSTVTRTLTGKSVEEDRADVYKAAVELLDATNAPADQKSFTALLNKLDTATAADIPPALVSKIRFADLLNVDKLKITTYQALVTFASLSKASSPDKVIASRFADGPKTIFIDQEAGIAQVPMNMFVNQDGQANTFSIEFVYIGGTWKMSPYSVLDQLRLSLALQQQIAASKAK